MGIIPQEIWINHIIPQANLRLLVTLSLVCNAFHQCCRKYLPRRLYRSILGGKIIKEHEKRLHYGFYAIPPHGGLMTHQDYLNIAKACTMTKILKDVKPCSTTEGGFEWKSSDVISDLLCLSKYVGKIEKWSHINYQIKTVNCEPTSVLGTWGETEKGWTTAGVLSKSVIIPLGRFFSIARSEIKIPCFKVRCFIPLSIMQAFHDVLIRLGWKILVYVKIRLINGLLTFKEGYSKRMIKIIDISREVGGKGEKEPIKKQPLIRIIKG